MYRRKAAESAFIFEGSAIGTFRFCGVYLVTADFDMVK